MKKKKNVSHPPIFVSLAVIVIDGQTYDCQAENIQFRNDKKLWIVQDSDQPFSAADISQFSDLFYYPVDSERVFPGTLSPASSMQVVNVGTTDGRTVQLYDYGNVNVNIGGKMYNLSAYKNINMPEFKNIPNTVFIPIKDRTSGANPKTTFASGRYLILKPPASGNQVVVDFNMATNPYENYNSSYSTLLVPASNTIQAPIMTGERKYEDR